MTYEQLVFYIFIFYIIFVSFISMILFLKDKNLAKNNEIRIQEKTLLQSVVYGGALGGLIGRILAHHKTNKIYFSLVIYLSLLLQIVCAIVLGINAFI